MHLAAAQRQSVTGALRLRAERRAQPGRQAELDVRAEFGEAEALAAAFTHHSAGRRVGRATLATGYRERHGVPTPAAAPPHSDR